MNYVPFATRNRKELLRDPMSLIFSIGLPLVLLLFISAIQKKVPVDIFKIEKFAPGIIIFSFTFITLFSGMLIAKDRCSSFLTRLFASPLSATEYIIGYSLPLLPMALMQCVVCFIAAFFLGLTIDVNVFLTMLLLIPVAVLFIGFGLLFGCIFNDKQVGGVASILINFVALSSGLWFDLNLLGNTLKFIAYVLPFAHAVDATQAALAGDYAYIFPHLWWVLGYAVIIYAIAVLIFRKRMRD